MRHKSLPILSLLITFNSIIFSLAGCSSSSEASKEYEQSNTVQSSEYVSFESETESLAETTTDSFTEIIKKENL